MGRVSRAARQVSYLVPGIRFAGGACWVAWVFALYSGEFFFGSDAFIISSQNNAYFISTISLTISLLGIGFFHTRLYSFVQNNRFIFAMSVVASLGTAMVIFGAVDEVQTPAFFIGNVITGFGTSWLAMRLAVQISELRPIAIMIISVLVQVVGCFIYVLAIQLPHYSGIALLITIPVLAALLFSMNGSEDRTAKSDGSNTLPRRFIWFAFTVFVLFVAFSVIRGYYPNFITSYEFALSRGMTTMLCFIGYTVIVVAGAFMQKDSSVGAFLYWTMVGLVAIFAVAPLLGIGSAVSGSWHTAANVLCNAAIWTLLCSVAHKSGSSTLRVVGIGYAIVAFGSTVGIGLGWLLFIWGVGDASMARLSAIILIILLIIVLVGVQKKDLAEMTQPAEEEEEGLFDFESTPAFVTSAQQIAGVQSQTPAEPFAEADKPVPWWKLRMENIALAFGLTKRELDILIELGKGKDIQTIAGDLYISYNTARAHVRNIYAKCGVHSRHELQQIIDSDEYRVETHEKLSGLRG